MIDKLYDECCGCGACSDVCAHKAISFSHNSEGFFFPTIDKSLCSECNFCEDVCPILNSPIGNPIQNSLAAYAKRKPHQSSSGGLFSIFATAILDMGGVVYGAAYNEKLSLCHKRVSCIEELPSLCGSKYVQSDCTGIYKLVRQDLKQDAKVLFVGTPCQVAGLRNYLRSDYDNLYLVDLVRHGVPSPGIFTDYIHYCEKIRSKKVVNFLIRDNRDGWNNIFKSTLVFLNGKEEYNSMLTNLWNRIFFSEMAIRKSCEQCKFANQFRVGDITLGDFWGIENVNKLMYNKDGVSLLLVNTDKGAKLVETTKMLYTSAKAYTIEKEHPNLYHSTKQSPIRTEFMIDYVTYGFAFIAKKYFGYDRKLDFKIRLTRFLHRLLNH